jgi:hypothetical protein
MDFNAIISKLGPLSFAALFLIGSFLFIALPLWSLVDCGGASRRGGMSGAIWMVAIIFLPGIGPICYGLFGSRSGALKVGMGAGILGLVCLAFLSFDVITRVQNERPVIATTPAPNAAVTAKVPPPSKAPRKPASRKPRKK